MELSSSERNRGEDKDKTVTEEVTMPSFDAVTFHGPQFGPDKNDVRLVVDAAEMLADIVANDLSDEEIAAIERLKAWLGPRAETPDLRAAKAAIARLPLGFALLGPNVQGCEEWRHESTGILFVQCPGEEPFLIGKYPLTQAQWCSVMGTDPSQFKGGERPVGRVSWNDCQAFCEKTGLCLPTEAEWETACRAGSTGVRLAMSL